MCTLITCGKQQIQQIHVKLTNIKRTVYKHNKNKNKGFLFAYMNNLKSNTVAHRKQLFKASDIKKPYIRNNIL